MGEQDWLAERFEDSRTHLRAVADRERIRQLDLSILNG